jgi:hypothetical protein
MTAWCELSAEPAVGYVPASECHEMQPAAISRPADSPHQVVISKKYGSAQRLGIHECWVNQTLSGSLAKLPLLG